jgi:Holliday junction resolvase
MYKKLQPINKIEDKNKGIKEVKSFSYAKEQISVPLAITEFYEACKDYPILFAKDVNGSWMATAMLGYKEKENLFIDEEGVWEKQRYIPAHIRRYPFIYVNNTETKELTLAVDGDYKSEDTQDEVRKLFLEDGTNSEFLNGVLRFLNQFHGDALATEKFIKQLENWDLLEEKVAQIVTPDGKNYNINGFYVVNEEKLKHLSKKKRDAIWDKNVMPLIIAHLISLSNIQKIGAK